MDRNPRRIRDVAALATVQLARLRPCGIAGGDDGLLPDVAAGAKKR